MIEYYFKAAGDLEFKRISEFRVGCWIYAKQACLEDLTKIVEITGLDMADIRDSLDKYELPRVEHLEESIIFFVRHPGEQEWGLYTETLTMILTNKAVIAISPHRSEIVEQLIASNTPLGTLQKTKLILYILLKITQDYTNSIKRVRHSILEPRQEKLVDSNTIIVLMKNEEILNQYLTVLVPLRNVLEILATGRHMNLYESDMDLLEDLMIAIRQSEDVCRVNIKSIRSLRDSYQIIFTNDVNRTIKLLTALTVIVTIPTIITSIYGMNVSLPFQNRSDAFLVILAITFLFTVVAILLFLRKRWL